MILRPNNGSGVCWNIGYSSLIGATGVFDRLGVFQFFYSLLLDCFFLYLDLFCGRFIFVVVHTISFNYSFTYVIAIIVLGISIVFNNKGETMAKIVFESGSLVRLKSGGPIMTVDHTINEGSVVCCWFDESKYSSAILNCAAIVAVSAAEQAVRGINVESPR